MYSIIETFVLLITKVNTMSFAYFNNPDIQIIMHHFCVILNKPLSLHVKVIKHNLFLFN